MSWGSRKQLQKIARFNAYRKCPLLKNIFKVIASMTVGKDVSALFPDVVNCMQTENLELKKLVYLYLMNYAKSQLGFKTF